MCVYIYIEWWINRYEEINNFSVFSFLKFSVFIFYFTKKKIVLYILQRLSYYIIRIRNRIPSPTPQISSFFLCLYVFIKKILYTNFFRLEEHYVFISICSFIITFYFFFRWWNMNEMMIERNVLFYFIYYVVYLRFHYDIFVCVTLFYLFFFFSSIWYTKIIKIKKKVFILISLWSAVN